MAGKLKATLPNGTTIDFDNGITAQQVIDALTGDGTANLAGAIPIETIGTDGWRNLRFQMPNGAQKAA